LIADCRNEFVAQLIRTTPTHYGHKDHLSDKMPHDDVVAEIDQRGNWHAIAEKTGGTAGGGAVRPHLTRRVYTCVPCAR
jgi:hypothetical protein